MAIKIISTIDQFFYKKCYIMTTPIYGLFLQYLIVGNTKAVTLFFNFFAKQFSFFLFVFIQINQNFPGLISHICWYWIK